jgi:hypothetical protein
MTISDLDSSSGSDRGAGPGRDGLLSIRSGPRTTYFSALSFELSTLFRLSTRILPSFITTLALSIA